MPDAETSTSPSLKSIADPTLPTRTPSDPRTSTLDATLTNSPELDITISPPDTTLTPSPNAAEPDKDETSTSPAIDNDPDPPTKPDNDPDTDPDSEDAPTPIDPVLKPLIEPSDATDTDPPGPSRCRSLRDLASARLLSSRALLNNVARFRLYRHRFLQENTCFAAFFKIYQIIKLKILKLIFLAKFCNFCEICNFLAEISQKLLISQTNFLRKF